MIVYSPHFEITLRLLNLIAEIAAVGELIVSSAILPLWEIQLKREALLRMAHHSTAIEGNPLNERQVAGLFEGSDIAAREKDKREVLNYMNTLRLIDQMKEPLGLDILLQIHASLMQGLLAIEVCGKVRQEPVAVVDHRGHIVFQTPPPEEVPVLLEDFLAWLNGPSKDFHPVIVSSIAHYELVRIHPFLDGNGRTARALATLILYLRGFDTRRFFSLDEYYNTDLPSYYAALAQADRTGDLSGWLEYVAEGVAISMKRVREAIREFSLDDRLRQSKGQIYLDERQMAILRAISEKGRLRIAEVQSMFGISREMANRLLDPLLENRLILRAGLGRATYYHLP